MHVRISPGTLRAKRARRVCDLWRISNVTQPTDTDDVASPRRIGSTVAMSFMGEISDIGVADLLYLLALRQQSGRLSVVANGDEASLFFDQGRMVMVTSSNMAMRLGRMLVRLDLLTNDRLKEALRLQDRRGDGRPLGTILIDEGFITERQLHQCIEEQCIEVLARFIVAETGIFVFHRNDRVSPKAEIVPLNSDRIMLEAMRRTDDLAALRAMLPDEVAPLLLGPTIDSDADEMSDIEIAIASEIYERSTNLRGLRERLSYDDATLWRTVLRMRERGWIIVGQHEPTFAESVFTQIHVAAD